MAYNEYEDTIRDDEDNLDFGVSSDEEDTDFSDFSASDEDDLDIGEAEEEDEEVGNFDFASAVDFDADDEDEDAEDGEEEASSFDFASAVDFDSDDETDEGEDEDFDFDEGIEENTSDELNDEEATEDFDTTDENTDFDTDEVDTDEVDTDEVDTDVEDEGEAPAEIPTLNMPEGTAMGTSAGYDASSLLNRISNKFHTNTCMIKLSEIGLSEPVKKGRQNTISGLTKSIKDLGVVTPIHVMKVSDDVATDNYRYVLIDGLRRMYGALKNNMVEIPAVVWEMENKDKGMELLLALSLTLNRTQKRSWQENWDLYRILEMQSAVAPSTLEYLLQLEAGDAMKLKDVMLCDYDEVKEALLGNAKSLDGCYKMLQKLRKEEDQLAKEDATGITDSVEDAEELTGDVSERVSKGELSDDDVMELLEMADSVGDDSLEDDTLGEEDFDSMNKVDSDFVDQQQVGDRHPIDPALRNAVLARDDFHCKCCGMRMIGARLGLIAVHHILPVHVGGKDTMDNLTTLCVNCHINLHIMERNGGSIMMSKEDFDSLTENEQVSLKRALKLARVAIQADKRRGLNKDKVMKETKNAIAHPMPGVGMKENEMAYADAKSKRS